MLKQKNKVIYDKIADILNGRQSMAFRLALGASLLLAMWGIVSMVITLRYGVGVWGINDSVVWAVDITNFVFWIGIGHAGTLISAILLLLRQEWRSAFSRLAEAMTIIAVICAAIFVIMHTGRQWFTLYWLFPYPNQMGIYPNFQSPLIWDVFAIVTYFIVSLMFWYAGMIPDFASLGPSIKKNRLSKFFFYLSLGWKGSGNQWNNYRKMYTLLAGLATPLVISVHTVVSFDFAVTLLPGWHSTIFPPYFVSGAIYSGCAMVVTLTIVTRKLLGLEDIITIGHLDKLNKVMLTTGLFVTFSYFLEFFFAWYSGNTYELFMLNNRFSGQYSLIFITMFLINLIIPQLLWSGRIRRNLPAMLAVSIMVNIGMWLERFAIIVIPLHRDYLPSAWEGYSPTWVEISLLLGSIGIFFTLYLLFLKYFPVVHITEMLEARRKEHE